MCGLTNDLTWAEERSALALTYYMPHVSQEVACIVRLGAHQLVSWPADSSTSEEEEEEQEEVCKQLDPGFANCWKLVFSSSYAGCFLPCLLVLSFLHVGSLCLFWGMVVRGCARRDLC